MGFEPGGRADKLGNRYEGRWVAKQLLRLIDEQIASVTVEAVGDDESGVDLWITLKDGRRQAQQCKARNGSRETWPVSDLRSRGVLASLGRQLGRAPNIDFAFVSAVPVIGLGDVCNSARNSPGPEQFFEHQVDAQGRDRRVTVEQFCNALDLDRQTKSGRAWAHDLLRRTYIELYPDNDSTWHDLLTQARHLLTGQPESAIAVLCQFAENKDRLGRPIYPDELREYLRSQGMNPRDLVHDSRISPQVQRLQEEFDDSIRPLLIGGSCIHRDETDACLEMMKTEPVIILHGPAGCGKSGVLYELMGRLRREHAPILPLRLDRRMPSRTAAQYGADVGLPESPVHCLVALADGRPSVLVLDQLDAIRWTASHSADAMDVCREMLKQVLSFRHQGKDVKVVLACRTFDLQNDPQIRSLLADRQAKVEVGQLSEASVRSVVGPSYSSLTARQQRILGNPQNLSMWAEMRQGEAVPAFYSATELMKRFWTFKWTQLEKEGIDTVDIRHVLEKLVDWMDRRGAISAPDRVVSGCSQAALAALQSHGVLQAQNQRLSFAHQSYLDHLIAVRALQAIDQGRTILDWVGSRERQSLFRREQLRQALVLLEGEASARFRKEVQSILAAADVRFHLKHLVLEVIGQTESVDDALADWCIDLLNDDHWRPHALTTVFLAHAPHVQLLADRGVLTQWLESPEEEKRNWALNLLKSVVDKLPDLVAALLSPLAQGPDDMAQRALWVIGWNTASEADAISEIHLRLASRGLVHDLVAWPDLCSKHPVRALRLLGAYVSTWTEVEDDMLSSHRSRSIDRASRQDAAALSRVAQARPLETWDLLMSHIVRLTTPDEALDCTARSRWYAQSPSSFSVGETHLARAVVEMLIEAGRRLAQAVPSEFLQRSEYLDSSGSRLVEQILAAAYSSLPPTHADAGIEWLLRDPARLSLGDGETELAWTPAARIIQTLSPHCAPGLFRELEQTLIRYRDPHEYRSAQRRLQSWREGYFIPYWGREQCVLLPALCSERRHRPTSELIGLLKKRFVDWPEAHSLHPVSMGGWVGSKLDEHLDRISDKSWLAIVGNKRLPYEGHGTWQQVDDDHVVESSVRQFAGSLGRIAQRYPERFGRLALQFPPDAHPAYVSAILDAVRLIRPDPAQRAEGSKDWQPASPSTVMAVVERFANTDDREAAKALCWLVRSRPEEEWPANALRRLEYYAQRHPDPEPGKLNVHCDKSSDDATVDVLFQNTINCVRGVAAGAIGRLLWQHPNLLGTLRTSVTSLVADPHLVVRMAAIEALLPVLNIDRDQAVDWFCRACRDDERIAASPHGISFLNYTIRGYFQQLGPLVRKMAFSVHPDVAEQGAQAVAAYWLFYGLFEEGLAACQQGTPQQRRGVARVAASWIAKDGYADRCRELIKPYFDDPAKEVRGATSAMWGDRFVISSENLALARTYVRSRAFTEEPSRLLRFLGAYQGSLAPLSDVVVLACEALAPELQLVVASQPLWYEATRIPGLLLRLYEQTHEQRPDIANRCLDAWDMLLEKGVGMARELTRVIDA